MLAAAYAKQFGVSLAPRYAGAAAGAGASAAAAACRGPASLGGMGMGQLPSLPKGLGWRVRLMMAATLNKHGQPKGQWARS